MFFDTWLVLFSISCFANVLGLNISATFNSAVTIYILIPILIIPQMILGGAMFNYQKLNRMIGGGYNVPVIAELMTARWGYEALMVNQFVNNEYEKIVFDIEKKESKASYKQTSFVSELKNIANESNRLLKLDNDSAKTALKENLTLLRNELIREAKENKEGKFSMIEALSVEKYTSEVTDSLNKFLDGLTAYYSNLLTIIQTKKDLVINKFQSTPEKEKLFRKLYNNCYNNYLADIVKMSLETDKIVRGDGKLIQVVDPVFLRPEPSSFIDVRAHFYAPQKHFAGKYYGTLGFNVSIIWLFTLILYFTLYFETLKKALNFYQGKKKKVAEE